MAKKVEVDFKLIIIALALMVIASVGTGFTAYLMLSGTVSSIQGQALNGNGSDNQKADLGPTYELADFTVNLADTSPIRFVRTGIVLELDKQETVKEIERRVPQIRDHIISIIRSYYVADLSGSAGLNNLRNEIITAINGSVMSGKVADIFFVDLVIQ